MVVGSMQDHVALTKLNATNVVTITTLSANLHCDSENVKPYCKTFLARIYFMQTL